MSNLRAAEEPEVAGGDVDDAVGQLELVEELPLPREQPLVLVARVVAGT